MDHYFSGLALEVDHPEFGPLKEVRTAIHIQDQPEEHRAGPALGADTEPLLRELLGYTEKEITGLRASGVI